MISLWLRSRRKRKAANGGFAYVTPPMGYRAVGKEWVPDEVELAVVVRIRDLRGGRSLRAIADVLDREGLEAGRAHGTRGPSYGCWSAWMRRGDNTARHSMTARNGTGRDAFHARAWPMTPRRAHDRLRQEPVQRVWFSHEVREAQRLGATLRDGYRTRQSRVGRSRVSRVGPADDETLCRVALRVPHEVEEVLVRPGPSSRPTGP
jgi:hypothetical protein